MTRPLGAVTRSLDPAAGTPTGDTPAAASRADR
jgi:hypothetical protein